MVRRWLAVRGVARLKQEASSRCFAIETMMESILTSGCYSQQHKLSQDDQDTSDNQRHLVAEVMGQVSQQCNRVGLYYDPLTGDD